MDAFTFYINMSLGHIDKIDYPDKIDIDHAIIKDFDCEVERFEYTRNEIQPWFKETIHTLPNLKKQSTVTIPHDSCKPLKFGIIHILQEITDKPEYTIDKIRFQIDSFI